MASERTDDARDAWDRLAKIYTHELDPRFAAIVDLVVAAAAPLEGETVIDLGTGTGAAALDAAQRVGPSGRVLGVDISPQMLAVATGRARAAGVTNVDFREGSAHEIPIADARADALLSSLCLMFVPDRARAAIECARVLRPGGRFVASVWGAPERCDFVRLQMMVARAGGFPAPPDVSPVSMADPASFLEQLRNAGIEAEARRERVSFSHDTLQQAFEIAEIVVRVTLTPEDQRRVKQDIAATMWPDPARPRTLHNEVVLITGHRTDG